MLGENVKVYLTTNLSPFEVEDFGEGGGLPLPVGEAMVHYSMDHWMVVTIENDELQVLLLLFFFELRRDGRVFLFGFLLCLVEPLHFLLVLLSRVLDPAVVSVVPRLLLLFGLTFTLTFFAFV